MLPQKYSMGGTTHAVNLVLPQENTSIIIENISMFSKGSLVYKHQPARHKAPQPQVLASLEKSLTENASVWEELSKY
jgi:hypothetical protein